MSTMNLSITFILHHLKVLDETANHLRGAWPHLPSEQQPHHQSLSMSAHIYFFHPRISLHKSQVGVVSKCASSCMLLADHRLLVFLFSRTFWIKKISLREQVPRIVLGDPDLKSRLDEC